MESPTALFLRRGGQWWNQVAPARSFQPGARKAAGLFVEAVMGIERDTLEERYAKTKASLALTGFTEGDDGVWRNGNRTARLVEKPNLYRGGPIPDFIDGKPVDPVHKEPKLFIEYGEETEDGGAQ